MVVLWCVCSVEERVHYENDGDTFRGFGFCLFRDRDQGQVDEEDEILLCHGDIRCCVSVDHDFGLYWRGSLIKAILKRRTSNVFQCR